MIRLFGSWVATALTRVALRMYPSSFRREMGRQIEEDARRRAGEFEGVLAPVTMAAWLVRLSVSLVMNGIGAWREDRIAPRGRYTEESGAFSWLDVKLGLRMLVKYPGLTFAGGLGIAVAIAIAGGFFAFAHAYLYPTIPLPEGDRLVGLENWDVRFNDQNRRSIHDYYIWREEMESVEDMSAFMDVDERLIWPDGTVEEVRIARMTPSGFPLAQVPPLLGRSLVESDMDVGAPPVIVIGYEVWRTRLAADPDVLGTDLRIGDAPHRVVGVMPEGFAFPIQHEYWVPLKARPIDYPLGQGPRIFVSGRLADGYDLEAAQAELTVISARMADEFPESHGQFRAQIRNYAYPLLDIDQQGGASSLWQFIMMNALLSLVLVVVCLNVAVLAYARAAMRSGEIAVRTALGASRLRIVGQMSVEMLVLCGLAAFVGVVILNLGLTQVELMMETELGGRPFWMNLELSGSGIAYVLALTLVAVVITGVLPALQSTARNVQHNLSRFSSRNGPRLGRTWTALIVIQIALAVAALPLATAMAWWEVRDSTTSLKIDVDQYVWFRTGDYSPGLRAELSRRIESDADVLGYEFVFGFPDGGRAPGGGRPRLGLEDPVRAGSVDEVLEARVTPVGHRFFEMVGLAADAGRTFRTSDWDEGAWNVAVVNRALADRTLGGRDAVGKRFRWPNQDGGFVDNDEVEWIEVIGVVENIDEHRFAPWFVESRIYLPIATDAPAPLNGLIRTAGADPRALMDRLRGHVTELDPELPTRIALLGDVYRREQLAVRLAALILALSLFAVLALSSAGIYAMMSFTVSRRYREIGIRTALGAHPRLLLRGIFGRALGYIVLGVVVGVAASLGMDRLAGGELLHGLGSPLLTVIVLLMGVVGFTAAMGPARRGLRIAPTEALSAE